VCLLFILSALCVCRLMYSIAIVLIGVFSFKRSIIYVKFLNAEFAYHGLIFDIPNSRARALSPRVVISLRVHGQP